MKCHKYTCICDISYYIKQKDSANIQQESRS